MADAAKRHVRQAKVKVKTKVYVHKTFFYSDADPNEKFYGEVVKVLPNGNLKIKWDIDNTYSGVLPKDIKIVSDLIQDNDIDFSQAKHVNSIQEKEVIQTLEESSPEATDTIKVDQEMFQENVRSLRKRKNISYDDNVHSKAEDSFLEESAENPDDTRVLAEASPVTMKVKIEGKTPARKKRQLNNNENVSSANMMQQSNTGLTINEALDILASNNQWVGADLFMTTPEDANCSDEDSADEEDPHQHNLSKKQLLAQCQLRLRENGSDEMREIDSDKEQIGESSTSQSSSSSAKASTSSASITTIAKASTTANIWKPSKGENEKQMELREKVKTFKAPKNLEIERLDNENHNWSHVRCFKLFFDNEYVDHIVQMSNQYAI